ncbi:MAG: iron ABC transporter permease [Spirochaetia bacterium]|nr:iron ABC transporter permease [Spirochaetia bacterium]
MHDRLKLPAIVLLVVVPLATALLSISIGRFPIPFSDIISVLTGGHAANQQMEIVIRNIRIPRILLAMLVGAGLSVSGAAFQSLFTNPLATPDTVGVASGASFGAVLALSLGFSLIGVQILALVFGLVAVMLTFLTGNSNHQMEPATVILAGIIIGALFNAFITLVKYTADAETQLPSISYWLMGSLSSANYHSLLLGAPFIVVGLVLLYLLRWRLNILTLSVDEAKSTGTNVGLLRATTVISATMITASAVSMCGQVGWVGLLVPHACRMLFGSDNSKLVPASISIGATFMLIIDTLARSATASEIPISVLTAIVGAPFFILLLRRKGGWSL